MFQLYDSFAREAFQKEFFLELWLRGQTFETFSIQLRDSELGNHFVNIVPHPPKSCHLYGKDAMNCPEKVMKISHFNQDQSAHSIYIKIELCYFSLDQ